MALDEVKVRDKVRGCLLGGAVGDALGAPVEFLQLREIRSRYGPAGITDFDEAYGVLGAITDDTQMTLFSAEALLNRRADPTTPLSVLARQSYERWMLTQGESAVTGGSASELSMHPSMNHRRGPGNTCLSALSIATVPAVNDSKGCGGVMRAAPAGLIGADTPFEDGVMLAAVTHGHVTGQLTAGFLAEVTAMLVEGDSLPVAVDRAVQKLDRTQGAAETKSAIDAALAAVAAGVPASADVVTSLGAGWVAEEALSIGLYCALVAEDFRHGVTLAVNHSGDSDSTGAICGNLLGAALGVDAIPTAWRERVELAEVILRWADRLADAALEDHWSARLRRRLTAWGDDEWAELGALADAFRSEDSHGEMRVDGMNYWAVMSESTTGLYALLGTLTEPFGYSTEVGRFPNGEGLADAAVEHALAQIVVVHRAERFSTGSMLSAADDGTLAAIVDRLLAWRRTGR